MSLAEFFSLYFIVILLLHFTTFTLLFTSLIIVSLKLHNTMLFYTKFMSPELTKGGLKLLSMQQTNTT